jgi:Shikimate 5-dehydrogenase
MKLYGLIGYPLSHSFSKKYFDEKFEKEKITGVEFRNFSIGNISLLQDVIELENLQGFAITIPYKREVISFLSETTAAVQKMNACNCVKISNGKLYGFNTDVTGFKKSFIQHLQPHHNKALVLGTGGAAAAVAYSLNELNIPFKFVSRTKAGDNFTYGELNKKVLEEYPVIINATPVGTYPKGNECPAIPYHFLTPQHYLFDLIYNPEETKFLRSGKEKGAIIQNGYPMLVLQAEENWKIWNR